MSDLGYALYDSGNLAKLERFGPRLIARPSTLAVWKRKRSASEWGAADAIYDPDSGWRFRSAFFEEWDVQIAGITLRLRLQRNGQVGLFPEHANYLPSIANRIKSLIVKNPSRRPRVLNLFAFTGMASVFCMKAGAEVTHVELQRSAIGWAEQNVAINELGKDQFRYIEDDAIKYISREASRDARYDIVIADPPSFSRISKNKEWQLDEKLPEIVSECAKLVQPSVTGESMGAVYITCHHPAFGSETIMNLFRDACDVGANAQIEPIDLNISESSGDRKLPTGQGAVLRGL